MKKLLLLSLLAVLAGPHLGWAATPTPNATQTAAQTQIQQTQTAIAATATYIATAFPSLTPTLTPTGTLSPSPTFTPVPKQFKPTTRERDDYTATQLTTANGTLLSTTAIPGGTTPWLTQVNNQTVAVLSTGSASTSINWVVPRDFKGDLKIYAGLNAAAIGDSVTITTNVYGQGFNLTTQTVGTYSYQAPTGGSYTFSGSGYSGNVIAGVQGTDPLWDSPVQVLSRVLLPANPGVNAYSGTNPLLYGATIHYGDELTVNLTRTSGGAGNVYLYWIEFQYDYYPGTPW